MKWKSTDYNYGDHFDGSFFTVPEDGIYTFYLTAKQYTKSYYGYAYIYVNENEIAQSLGATSNQNHVSISLTIKLQRDDKVKAKFTGNLYDLGEAKTTYFEGRLISKIESAQARIPVYGRYG